MLWMRSSLSTRHCVSLGTADVHSVLVRTLTSLSAETSGLDLISKQHPAFVDGVYRSAFTANRGIMAVLIETQTGPFFSGKVGGV